MKKISIFAAFILLISAQPAQAAASVVILNKSKISAKTGIVNLKVTNMPTGHGIYISQCMAIESGAQAPTACNPSAKSRIWISDVAADQKMGAISSKSKLSIKVDKYFTKGDCIHTKCILFVSNDHNAADDRSEDQAISFKFSGINLF